MKKSWRDNIRFYLIGPLVLTVTAFSTTVSEIFWSISNFQSVAPQTPVLGALMLAMVAAMLCGSINLPVIATANVHSLVMTWAAAQYSPGVAIVVATSLAGAGMAVMVGSCNGVLIAGIRVSPTLAILGTMTSLKEVNTLMTGSSAIANYLPWVLRLNHAQQFGIPLPMRLSTIVMLGLWILLEKMSFGRSIYLIGSSRQVAPYSGINTCRVLIRMYVVSVLPYMVIAFLMMSKPNLVKASYGESYLPVSILAAILDGVNPDGGNGRIIDMVLALLPLQIIGSSFNTLNINPYLMTALWGMLLLCFIQTRGMLGLNRVV